MSTKIYDAYICPKFRSIDHMHNTFKKIKDRIKKEVVKRYQGKIAQDWADYQDNCIIKNKKITSPFHEIASKASKEFQKNVNNSKDCDASYNFIFEIMIIPYRKNIYIKIFTQQTDLCNLLEEYGFKDFHYQNQTDRPEEISGREWAKRDVIWDNIFKNENTWRDIGISYNWSPSEIYDTPFSEEDIKYLMPSFKKRARRIAKDKIWGRVYRKKFKDDKPKKASKVAGEYRKFRDYLKTEKGKEEVKKKAKIIENKLKSYFILRKL